MDKKSILSSVIFGIVSFVIAWALGSILTASTGIPLIGGLVNGILTGMVLTIGLIARKSKFNATTMWLTFSLIAIPTTTLGPPGAYKIIIGLVAGLIWDIFYNIFYNKKPTLGLYIGGLLGSTSIMVLMVLFLKWGAGIENASVYLEKYSKSFWTIILMNVVITAIGIYIGNSLYNNRLKNLSSFKNIDNRE